MHFDVTQTCNMATEKEASVSQRLGYSEAAIRIKLMAAD